jgi:hypothetical protein
MVKVEGWNMKKMLLFSLCLACAGLAFPLSEYAFDSNKDGKPDKWYIYEDGYVNVEKSDLNFDGQIDFIVEFDKKGKKKHEEMDNNFDGKMDTFYYYENGIATQTTIDSNYDDKIDIWIYLQGAYVDRYEQDTDFDGVIDKTKIFGVK